MCKNVTGEAEFLKSLLAGWLPGSQKVKEVKNKKSLFVHTQKLTFNSLFSTAGDEHVQYCE